MADFKERLQIEADELGDRLTKLDEFIEKNPSFHDLDSQYRNLLIDQRVAMKTYLNILEIRLDLLNTQKEYYE